MTERDILCHAPVTLSVTTIHHDTHPEIPKSAKNLNFPFVANVHHTIQIGAKCTETHVFTVKMVSNDFCGSYRPLLQGLPQGLEAVIKQEQPPQPAEMPKSDQNRKIRLAAKIHQTIEFGAKCAQTHVLSVKTYLLMATFGCI